MSSSSSSSSLSSSSSYFSNTSSNPKRKKKNKNKRKLTNIRVCSEALTMIKFLGQLHTKKLDLKHEPKLRRAAFLDWISQLEVAFKTNRYTRKILKDYSTTNKIHLAKDNLVDILVYTVAYAFMEKSTRTSTAAYKNKGTELLKILHTKCASVDSHTKLRANWLFSIAEFHMKKLPLIS